MPAWYHPTALTTKAAKTAKAAKAWLRQIVFALFANFAVEIAEAHVAHLDADLAVTLDEDRPGMLAKALGCVSGAGINIDGYAEIGGVVHVLSPNLQGARSCLETSGFRIVQEQQVVLVPVADSPGAAAAVFQALAEAHINIRYTYLATRNRLVIAADRPDDVIKALAGTA